MFLFLILGCLLYSTWSVFITYPPACNGSVQLEMSTKKSTATRRCQRVLNMWSMDSQYTRRLQVASIISLELDCCKTGIILGQRTWTTHTLCLTLDLPAQKACSNMKPKRNYYIHRIDVEMMSFLQNIISQPSFCLDLTTLPLFYNFDISTLIQCCRCIKVIQTMPTEQDWSLTAKIEEEIE